MGDFDVHGSAHGNGLQVFRSHDAAHACPAGSIFNTGHYIGIAHQVFTGLTNNGTLDFIVTHFLTNGPLSFCGRLSPQIRGITDFDGAVVNPEIYRFFCLAGDDQVMIAGPRQFGGKESAHVGTS